MEFKDLPSDIQRIAGHTLAAALKEFGTDIESEPAKELTRSIKTAFVTLYSEGPARQDVEKKAETIAQAVKFYITGHTNGFDYMEGVRQCQGITSNPLSSKCSKCEEWKIRIEGEAFHFSRIIDGRTHEQYCPVNRAVATIFSASIVQGFQPPRFLQRYGKQFD